MNMRIIEVAGQIKVLTGLHIGAGNDDIHIGGIDNPVIKDSKGMPYIPGSSLKGKIRSLLEISEGLSRDGKPSTTKSCDSIIPKMFGDTSGENITRVLFRDAYLSYESKKTLEEQLLSPTEGKSENSIDRITGKAQNPRTTERVIPGLSFDFEIAIRLFEDDNEELFKEKLKKGMDLLEKDGLGGNVSRGYGKIKFQNLKWNSLPFEV